MARKIRLNFAHWGYDPENNFFTNFLRKKGYTVEISDTPDYIVYSNSESKETAGVRKSLKGIAFLKKHGPRVRQWLVQMPLLGRFFSDRFALPEIPMPVIKKNAVRIYYTWGISHADMKNCEWAFTEDYDEKVMNSRHLRLPWYTFYCNAGKELIKKRVDVDAIKKEKTKFCNFIYSNNAPFRNMFFKKLSRYKPIDAPGDCLRNMPPIEERSGGSRFVPGKFANWQEEKIDFLKPYKFSIAMETKDFLGYVSEKIYHPMVTNSIPIYWGNREIHKDFNTKAFVNYGDFEKDVLAQVPSWLLKIPVVKDVVNYMIVEPRAVRKMIDRIIEIDTNDEEYEKMLREPWYPDNRLTPYVDEDVIARQFKKIFGPV